ncbi:lamin tail domain-containing protein [Lacinutrix chionoecetis]
MKKIYFLLLTFLISAVSFGQGTIDFDTDANWSPSPGGYGDYTYTDAALNFTATGIDVFRNGTADQDGFPGGFGTYSVRLRNNASTSLTMMVTSGGLGTFSFQARRWDGSPATNFVVETTTDNGANWNASSVIDGTVTTDSDWKTITGSINSANPNVGVRIVSAGTTERLMVDNFTWTGFATACGVSFGATSYTCNTNTVGDNNDSVTISIPYTGIDAGITSVTTTSGGTVAGDDPSSVANGTIVITGLSEGDAWDVVLNGGDCDTISASGVVDAAECDPVPNTCFDLSMGAETFEIVTVTPNTAGDEWELNSGTYSLNAFCGGGCQEAIEAWMIFGPLDMTSVTDLNLALNAAESFGVTDLNINYTSAYSGCPSSTTWTTAQTLTDGGTYSIDLSAASGTDVFIGIQYLDDGVDGYSGWSLSNVNLEAFGTCPTLGTRPVSDCAVCDVILGAESYTCLSNTDGDNNDQVIINIPYTGSDNTITSVSTTSAGTVGGDDPATIADGIITITGLSEGSAWDITLNGGDCDGTTLSGTVPAANCDPVFLIINEIHADPSNAAGDVGDANGDGTADSNEDEFIEIYNSGTTAVDLSDYVIADGVSDRHIFPAGTILAPNSFITVFGGGTPTNIAFISQTASTGQLSLNNGGDTVTIRDNNDVALVVETYTAAGNNQSIARAPDFTGAFVDHTTIMTNMVLFSPGAKNDGTTLSVETFNTTSFSIYPNPTNTGFVNITTTSNEAINVTVFDILGKQVLSQTINNRLNVSNLNAGVYILKLNQNGATTTKKLVIK